LIHDAESGHYSRRSLLKRAAGLGLSVPAAAALFAGVVPLSALAQDATPGAGGTPSGATNPLGVDPKAPLDVVIFKGGYGDDYAVNVNTNLYGKLYPEAKITYQGIVALGTALQPRFVAGNPPDAIDNSGDNNLDYGALVADGQLADLGPLMSAVSYDTPGKTFADTLVPGTQANGVFDGKQLFINYALTVEGLWYNKALFDKNGWKYATTWDEHIALCKTIKAAGITPWATTGVYPQYLLIFVFNQMLYKHDPAAMIAIDNLEDGAWKSQAVTDVLTAMLELYSNDFILSGWEGLTHIQSQTEWLQGKAAFLPCGTWLENEMKGVIPDGFEMVVNPMPSLANDKMPFEAIVASAGEGFIVPSHAKNVKGGMEWLRLLFSVSGARFFSQNTKSLTVVNGSGDGLDLGTAFASAQAAIAGAGQNTFPEASFDNWYKDLHDEARNDLGGLLQGKMSVADYQSKVQDMADSIKSDSSVPRYKRPAAS
jgi:N-acetylglucosamine transport system substrate-binding protein